MATEATVQSKAYPKELLRLNKNLRIIQQACPLFVPLIEEGWLHPKGGDFIIADYLKTIINSQTDTLILGCTHYPVIKQKIAKKLGKKVKLVDSAEVLAEEVKSYLTKGNLLNTAGKGHLKIYASDDPTRFKKLAKHILGKELKQVYLKKLN